MNKHNDWTGDMRRRLAHREEPVPDNLWNKIEAQLDTTVCTSAKSQKPRHRTTLTARIVAWTTAAAATATLLVTVGHNTDKDTTGRLASTPSYKLRHADATTTAPTPYPTAADTYTAMANLSPRTIADRSTLQGSQQRTGEAPVCDEPELHDMPIETECVDKPTVADTDRNNRQTRAHYRQQTQTATYTHSGQTQTARLAIGVHAGGMLADNRNTAYPGTNILMSPTPTALGEFAQNSNIPAKYKETKHHSQPITIGLSVAYALNDRLSVTTGAVYTRAITDFIKSAGSDDIVERQKLHYIGVPLGVKYRVWGNNLVQTYATAGGEADFNVSAKMETGEQQVGVKHDRVQMSANAAVGIQVNVAPHVGVYAEPGVKYYFDNNSSVVTIFKDKPWSLNMNVGLRVDL